MEPEIQPVQIISHEKNTIIWTEEGVENPETTSLGLWLKFIDEPENTVYHILKFNEKYWVTTDEYGSIGRIGELTAIKTGLRQIKTHNNPEIQAWIESQI